MHKVEWNLYFVADYRCSCVTREDPKFVGTQIDQAKQDIKFNESNHDTKTDSLKSCVTFGDHCIHPNVIEMQVNNQFNILDC